jgi:predicted enzyme related to lactoylglutathione lyase
MKASETGLLVWFGVSDLPRACDFYGEVLGLSLAHLNDQVGWAEFRHPQSGARVGLRASDKEEIIPAGGATLVFDVQDLSVAMADLEKLGVPFLTGPMNLNGWRFATFIDPDGNQLQLREMTDRE